MTAAESPVGGNTLREDTALKIAIADAIVCELADHPMWIDDSGQALDYSSEREALIADFVNAARDAVLAVVAPHLDAAETALGNVRALADQWDAAEADDSMWTVYNGTECAEMLRAALASAEATADTQETP